MRTAPPPDDLERATRTCVAVLLELASPNPMRHDLWAAYLDAAAAEALTADRSYDPAEIVLRHHIDGAAVSGDPAARAAAARAAWDRAEAATGTDRHTLGHTIRRRQNLLRYVEQARRCRAGKHIAAATRLVKGRPVRFCARPGCTWTTPAEAPRR